MSNLHFLTDQPIVLPDIFAPRLALLYKYQLAARKKIVSVWAPAGYGKSASTILWLKDSDRKSVWLSLDAYCNTPAQFYKLFCTGLSRLQPENKSIDETRFAPFFEASSIEFTENLISTLQQDSENYVFVLDDYHLITNEGVNRSLPGIIGGLPNNFTVFILSRTVLSEHWLQKSEMINELSISDLAFTEEEIRKFFAANKKILSTSETEQIFALTSGWPIGISALIKSDDPLNAQLTENVLDDYIETHIWNKWSEELKSFLLRVSVADMLTIKLCKILTGREDSYNVLERLCTANMFIIRLSEDNYRFHHLFLDFLRLKCMALGIDIKPLNGLVTKFYMEQEDYLTSQRYALHSGDAGLISAAIIGIMTRPVVLPLDEFVTFYKVFREEELPLSVSEICPYTYVDQMWYYYFIGNAERTGYYYDRIYEIMPILIEKFPEQVQKCFHLSHYDFRFPMKDQMWARCVVPEIPAAPDVLIASNMSYLPFIHRGMIDYSELTNEESYRLFYEGYGRLPLVNRIIKEGALAISSGLLLEQNRLQEALDKAYSAKNAIRNSTGKDVIFNIHIHIAAIFLAMGNYDAYQAALSDTEKFITEMNAFQFTPNFKAYSARYYLQRGSAKVAEEWLANYFITEMEEPELYKLYQYITSTKSYIVLGELKKAFRYASKLKKLCEDFNRPLDAAEAWILLAVIYWKNSDRKNAINALKTALHYLEPHGFIRPVADEGESVLPILKIFKQNSERKNYIGQLDAKYIHRVYLAAHEQSKRVSGNLPTLDIISIKLTKQQQKIVNLLADGCANTDMVEATGLSLHTIRTHTMGAYKKLGVDNAADAVLKAKLLDIL